MQANYGQTYGKYFPNSAWLNKPNPAQTYYNDVARAIYPVGERAQREGVLPTEMRRGVSVSQTFHIFLPGSVQNASRLRIVGLLIDTQTNEILNADMQKLPMVVGTATAIHTPLLPMLPTRAMLLPTAMLRTTTSPDDASRPHSPDSISSKGKRWHFSLSRVSSFSSVF